MAALGAAVQAPSMQSEISRLPLVLVTCLSCHVDALGALLRSSSIWPIVINVVGMLLEDSSSLFAKRLGSMLSCVESMLAVPTCPKRSPYHCSQKRVCLCV